MCVCVCVFLCTQAKEMLLDSLTVMESTAEDQIHQLVSDVEATIGLINTRHCKSLSLSVCLSVINTRQFKSLSVCLSVCLS